ncbi:hypothetical protein [Gracilibacillus oryzae]|uniref:hypothetical protein n=1 Tax=Gracilibacillus oryzae TaxID=1672701 RepID=UPI00129634BF|nr:hypothetical protein [Gracilibacillus oryzae]
MYQSFLEDIDATKVADRRNTRDIVTSLAIKRLLATQERFETSEKVSIYLGKYNS